MSSLYLIVEPGMLTALNCLTGHRDERDTERDQR
jgi:hypothetical protein